METTPFYRPVTAVTAQALCAYLSLGLCWDGRLNGILSFCWPVPTREQVRPREAAFKARRIGGGGDQMHG
jgi:hypothetical protein